MQKSSSYIKDFSFIGLFRLTMSILNMVISTPTVTGTRCIQEENLFYFDRKIKQSWVLNKHQIFGLQPTKAKFPFEREFNLLQLLYCWSRLTDETSIWVRFCIELLFQPMTLVNPLSGSVSLLGNSHLLIEHQTHSWDYSHSDTYSGCYRESVVFTR